MNLEIHPTVPDEWFGQRWRAWSQQHERRPNVKGPPKQNVTPKCWGAREQESMAVVVWICSGASWHGRVKQRRDPHQENQCCCRMWPTRSWSERVTLLYLASSVCVCGARNIDQAEKRMTLSLCILITIGVSQRPMNLVKVLLCLSLEL